MLRPFVKQLARLRADRHAFQRFIQTCSARWAGEYEYEDPKSEDDVVNITYILRDGSSRKIRGKVGDNVMYLAHR
ncbi:unnamed protein product [Anisakis simplex]|uniref:Phage portal protein n=1 Tax=Anisakis simplex TaxID=6269 RepID=A0A0M3KDM7_ANISI|nr:unnamed protein product [Anisakis simplex]